MIAATKERCLGCRFWLAEQSTFTDNMDPEWGFGRCRREPPRIIGEVARALMPHPRFGEQVEPEIAVTTLAEASLFPTVHATDWCGQYSSSTEREGPIC